MAQWLFLFGTTSCYDYSAKKKLEYYSFISQFNTLFWPYILFEELMLHFLMIMILMNFWEFQRAVHYSCIY